MFMLLVACTGFNAEEGHLVWDQANGSAWDAYLATYRAKDDAGRRDEGSFTWNAEGDAWTFDGSVTGTEDWTGTIDVYGEASWTTSSFDGAWGVQYAEVAQDGITLDGEVEWTLALDGDMTGGSLEYTAYGEITASGDAEGTGLIDYSVLAQVDGNSVSIEAQGEIDGVPIDESFTLTVIY